MPRLASAAASRRTATAAMSAGDERSAGCRPRRRQPRHRYASTMCTLCVQIVRCLLPFARRLAKNEPADLDDADRATNATTTNRSQPGRTLGTRTPQAGDRAPRPRAAIDRRTRRRPEHARRANARAVPRGPRLHHGARTRSLRAAVAFHQAAAHVDCARDASNRHPATLGAALPAHAGAAWIRGVRRHRRLLPASPRAVIQPRDLSASPMSVLAQPILDRPASASNSKHARSRCSTATRLSTSRARRARRSSRRSLNVGRRQPAFWTSIGRLLPRTCRRTSSTNTLKRVRFYPFTPHTMGAIGTTAVIDAARESDHAYASEQTELPVVLARRADP